PMVQHVYEAALKAKNIAGVYIATDSKEVEEKCKVFTSNIIMTSKEHESGTDRLAEAVANIECGNVINVQGDEPLIDSKLIEELATTLESTETKGGEGVLRDVADYILDAQDILDKILYFK
ncbi:MAG: 3-deoxy-manno-octulosonate cytidylyltransferase, partial [Arcobacter sp.]|nr:3-deoxy-manno-octulosonate cytidylyltransferase [Arcobacter sp.]